MTRIVFLGTPDSAVPTLELLSRSFDVGLVVTQPDKPRGRSGSPAAPPIKTRAFELGIPVVQPIRSIEIANAIGEHGDFDLGVVVAYGRILRTDVLELPAMGLLNVHFSLLPRWRGAAPVARAVMAGDPMTGVTIIKIDEGLDTGSVLTAQAVDIGPGENAGELTGRLARLGARLILDAIPPYVSGELVPLDQTDEGLEYADKLTPEDRPLNTAASPEEFVNRVRGLAPRPGATLEIDGERFKILQARVAADGPAPAEWRATRGGLLVGLTEGAVELTVIQPPGRKPMSGSDWMRGARKEQGEVS